MLFAKQPSVMSVEGMAACLIVAVVFGAIWMLIQKAKEKELEWRAKRKAQKEAEKGREQVREGREGADTPARA